MAREHDDGVKYEPLFYDIETTGGNPLAEEWQDGVDLDGRVTCVGFGWFENWREADSWGDVEFETRTVWDESEYRLLRLAREQAENVNENVHPDAELFRVAWNIKKFDDPYMAARLRRFNQDLGFVGSDVKRLDMMKPASDDKFGFQRPYGESDYAAHIGVEVRDSTDGGDMPGFFIDGEWEKIGYHCDEDVKVMMEIFWRKREVMMNWFYDKHDVDSEWAGDEMVEL